MVTPFNIIIQWGMILAIGVMPFAISFRLCWVCTSRRRGLAVVLALITGAIFLIEISSGGTLQGFIWILSFPFVSISVVTLYVTEMISRTLTRSKSHDALHSGDEPTPNNAKGSVDRA